MYDRLSKKETNVAVLLSQVHGRYSHVTPLERQKTCFERTTLPVLRRYYAEMEQLSGREPPAVLGMAQTVELLRLWEVSDLFVVHDALLDPILEAFESVLHPS